MAITDESTETIDSLFQKLDDTTDANTTERIVNSIAAQIITRASAIIRTDTAIPCEYFAHQMPGSRSHHTARGYLLRYVEPTKDRNGAALVYGGPHVYGSRLLGYVHLFEEYFCLVSIGLKDSLWVRKITRLDLKSKEHLKFIWDVIRND